MYKTDGNLQSAFARESQAYIRYTLFAGKADAEGFPELAGLFRAAAEAEMVHARNHFSVMGGLGSTKDNLLAAATAEHYEITRVYPGFIEDAQIERNEHARITFDYALKAEQVHNGIFEKALSALKGGQKSSSEPFSVCMVCGNMLNKEIPPKCPICGNSQEKYKRVE